MAGVAVLLFVAACSDAEPRPADRALADGDRFAPAPAVFTDRRSDCGGCVPGLRLTRLDVMPVDSGADLGVAVSGGGAPGDQLWLWFEAAAAHPVLLEREDRGWRLTVPEASPVDADDVQLRGDERRLVIRVRGMRPEDGVAVVSGGGDRIPAVGYASARGAALATRAGAPGAEVDEAMASVQSGFPGLDAEQQELARVTIARQLTPGTYRYDLAFADRPDLQLVAEVTVRFPELAQHVYLVRGDEVQLAQSLFVLVDGTTLCTWMIDRSADCAATAVPLPVAGVVGMVADPASVRVERTAARAVLEHAAPCWRVVATTETGPPEGESCALADGALAVNDNLRTGHRLVLTERRDAVSDAAFLVP